MFASGKNLCETHIVGLRVRQSGIHYSQCAPLESRGIYSVGSALIAGRYEIVRLNPDFEHLTVCAAGAGLSLIDGKWMPWREGSIVFSPRGAPHGSWSVPGRGHGQWVLSWITFSNALGESRRIPFEKAVMVHGRHQILHSLVQGLEREIIAASDPVALFHWVELIAHFADRVLLQKPGDSRLELLWNQIQDRIGEDWSVSRMAQEIGVSGAHLLRLCRKELGFGPNRQLARLRLKHASMLLTRTAMSVEEVANAVGYSDAFAFSTSFRRQMGTSPRKFRQPPA